MDHLETFPDIYIPWSTYVPVSWDFSDFSDHLNEILVSDDSRVAMARKAQDVYLNHLNNHELFCQHFLGILFAAHHLENAH